MSDKKQSSIDWLIGQLKAQYDIDIERLTVTDKAKAMHKEEVEIASECGFKDGNLYANGEQWAFGSPEQYYNETFNSDEA